MKPCDCNCGDLIPDTNKLGRPARYKHGHNNAGGRFKQGEHTGPKHPKWKGGRHVMNTGYVEIWTPNGYVLEHRLVMETHLGRKLANGEQVHHRNGDRQDNRLANLELTTIGEHTSYHWHSEKKYKVRYVMKSPNKFGGTKRIT